MSSKQPNHVPQIYQPSSRETRVLEGVFGSWSLSYPLNVTTRNGAARLYGSVRLGSGFGSLLSSGGKNQSTRKVNELDRLGYFLKRNEAEETFLSEQFGALAPDVLSGDILPKRWDETSKRCRSSFSSTDLW